MNKYLLLLLLVPLIGLANEKPKKGKYEKSKTINKEYKVNAYALLKINNKYGNLDVVSWNENRVVIEVKITVSGNNEEKVKSRLDKINIIFNASSSEVSAKTVIEKSSSSWFGSNNNMNYQINYTVKMPISNEANLVNDYGTISLNELKGKARINCDYGKILIGSLHHAENKINMDYTSNSVIEFINGGTINADYSGLRIDKAKNIALNADYTNTDIGHIENLNFICDYGKIEVGNANVIVGNGDYLTMRFGTIYKKLKVTADYGGIKVNKLMKGFESVYINSDYTGVKIGLDYNAAFNFTAKMSYGGFSYDGEHITYLKKIVKSSSKYYEGYVNKENSGATIEISSNYGSVKLYNN
ncbi:MAG: hypothetical protein L3J34_11775 [Flavobacteriaceae bacterium]|nr:hypothetical protein [Flavobacteriaceae bacterium]